MRIKVISPRADAMTWWRMYVLAALAIALAAGIFDLTWRGAERSGAGAVLAFNSSVASRNDSALLSASQPAVAVAQSMLNEATVLDLLRQAHAAPADVTVGIGEFRTRLEMQEPSPRALRVLYHDPDRRQARAVANAVATALVDWTIASPGPAAVQLPAITTRPSSIAAQHTAPRPSRDPLRSAYSSLAELEGQLAATDEKMASGNRQPASPERPAPVQVPNAVQNEQRRNLETKLAAAHQKLDDLRIRYTDEYPDVENTKDAIAELQHQLAALPPPTNPLSPPSGSSEPMTHESEMAQLRAERGRLTHQIAEQKRAIVHLRDHPAAAAITPSAQPAAAPAPPAPASTIASSPAWQNPFSIEHLAGTAPSDLSTPTALASMVSALFCAAAAFGIFLYWRHETRAALPAPAEPMEDAMVSGHSAFEAQPVVAAGTVARAASGAEPAPEPKPEPVLSAPEPVPVPQTVETAAAVPASIAPQPSTPSDPLPSLEAERAFPAPQPPVPPEARASLVSEPALSAPQPPTPSEKQLEAEPAVSAPEAPAAAEPLLKPDLETASITPMPLAHSEHLQTPEAAATSIAAEPPFPPELVPELKAKSALHILDEPIRPREPEAHQPSGEQPDKARGARDSSADPVLTDAEWNARILRAISRTAIGQQLESVHRGPADRPAADARSSESQEPESHSPQESLENQRLPGRMTDTRKFGS